MCGPVHIFVHCMWANNGEGQKGKSDLLELESEIVVNCPVWILRNDPGSSPRAAYALNIHAMPPAPSNASVNDSNVGLYSLIELK